MSGSPRNSSRGHWAALSPGDPPLIGVNESRNIRGRVQMVVLVPEQLLFADDNVDHNDADIDRPSLADHIDNDIALLPID